MPIIKVNRTATIHLKNKNATSPRADVLLEHSLEVYLHSNYINVIIEVYIIKIKDISPPINV